MNIYIDFEITKEKEYKCRIFDDKKNFFVLSNDIRKIATYIQSLYGIRRYHGDRVYVDNRGYGIALTDCFDDIGFKYEVLEYVSTINL